MMDIEVKLEHFEGPLDLLLYLIKQLEIDIYDIPIAEITSQYIAVIKQMDDQQLTVAGDFLVMASTLMEMKSEWLIPRQEIENIEEDEYDDPRQALTDMLVEYQLYKQAADYIGKKAKERDQQVGRPAADLSQMTEFVPLEANSIPIFNLQKAMQSVQRRYQLLNPADSIIEREKISLEDSMENMEDQVKQAPGQKIYFTECLLKKNRSHLVVSFLSLLELLKRDLILAFQEKSDQDILLVYKGGAGT